MAVDDPIRALSALKEQGSARAWPLLAFEESVARDRLKLEAVARKLLEREKGRAPSIASESAMEQARRQWRDFLARKSPLQRRALRSLCWDSLVAADPRFLQMLKSRGERPGASMIRGLLSTYHEHYGSECAQLENMVRSWLQEYAGKSSTLLRWKSMIAMLLGPEAAERMAQAFTGRPLSTSKMLKEFLILPASRFGHEVVADRLAREVKDAGERPGPSVVQDLCRTILAEDRRLLNREAFSSFVRALVAWGDRAGEGRLRDEVRKFVLTDEDLGDPRAYPERWRNMVLANEAKAVTAWMSSEDLAFFFDLILAKRHDPHGRRPFWTKLVRRVQASRVIICDRDRSRHRDKLEKLAAEGQTFPGMIGDQVTAFIMDFGSLVAIEFSAVGNACYLYQGPAFRAKSTQFIREAYPIELLKDTTACINRVIHSNGWQYTLENYLAKYGVRE